MKILVVEDIPIWRDKLREMYKEILELDAGDVDFASNESEAVDRLASSKYDLISLDLNLDPLTPDGKTRRMDSIDLIERYVLNKKYQKGIAVVIITGRMYDKRLSDYVRINGHIESASDPENFLKGLFPDGSYKVLYKHYHPNKLPDIEIIDEKGLNEKDVVEENIKRIKKNLTKHTIRKMIKSAKGANHKTNPNIFILYVLPEELYPPDRKKIQISRTPSDFFRELGQTLKYNIINRFNKNVKFEGEEHSYEYKKMIYILEYFLIGKRLKEHCILCKADKKKQTLIPLELQPDNQTMDFLKVLTVNSQDRVLPTDALGLRELDNLRGDKTKRVYYEYPKSVKDTPEAIDFMFDKGSSIHKPGGGIEIAGRMKTALNHLKEYLKKAVGIETNITSPWKECKPYDNFPYKLGDLNISVAVCSKKYYESSIKK